MFNFLRQFFKNPQNTGAVWPSSNELADLITNTAQLKTAKTAVEFGSGTGVFTEKIIQKINPRATFFSIEINPFFLQETKKKCPKAIVYEDSAINVKKYLKKHGRNNCDCIISGLPFASFDKSLQHKMLYAIYNSLNEHGEFLTFAYIHGLILPAGLRFRKLLKSSFKNFKTTRIVWKNFPPAVVYCCKK